MVTRLDLEYDGTHFFGWAAQAQGRAVESELARVLTVLSGGETHPLTVAGRTDRGVHAWGQVVSFPGEPPLLRSLNALLPPDIAVTASTRAPDGFDARRDATSRTYCYRLLTREARSPFRSRTELHWGTRPLDREALHACADVLRGVHDFTAFTLTETKHKVFAREVLRAEWLEVPDGLEFWIEATSFLRHMNRALMGTMLQVGLGKRTVGSFEALLGGAHRRDAGPTAPPHGLALAAVSYGV